MAFRRNYRLKPSTATASNAVAGVLAGLLVLIVSVVTDALVRNGTGAGLPSAWSINPVLWIVGAAPAVLGLLGALAGRRYDRISAEKDDLEHKINEQAGQLQILTGDFDDLTTELTKTESILKAAQRDNQRITHTLEDANRRLDEAVVQAQVLTSEAGSAGRARDEFLSSVTHELRTPLNGIIGMTDLAMVARTDPERNECLETVKMCGHSLLHLVSDILDYSQINAGKMSLDPVNFILRKTVDDAVTIARNMDSAKDLAFRCFYDPDVTEEYIGDPIRLRQILINLLGNAVKFTERGVIEVRVSTVLDDLMAESRIAEKPVKLKFAVSDTGIGIPQDKLDTIFEEFTQADNSLSRRYNGSGLGLAISSNLVKLMEGDIWVESAEQRGSTFFFTVVMDSALDLLLRPRKEGSAAEDADRQLRILVADDNVISQIVITRLLKAGGHKLMFGDDAEEVISLLEDRKFDLVFMGVHLPDMNGMEATALIRRKQAEQGIYTPIIGLVSDDEKDESRWCLKAGMDGVVLKPIDQRTLLKTMDQVVADSTRAALNPGPGRKSPRVPAASAPGKTTD